MDLPITDPRLWRDVVSFYDALSAGGVGGPSRLWRPYPVSSVQVASPADSAWCVLADLHGWAFFSCKTDEVWIHPQLLTQPPGRVRAVVWHELAHGALGLPDLGRNSNHLMASTFDHWGEIPPEQLQLWLRRAVTWAKYKTLGRKCEVIRTWTWVVSRCHACREELYDCT